MKAAIYTAYGPPEILQIVDVEKPFPKDDEVLIHVRAASVNPLDWHFLRGTPYFLRLMAGLRRPKSTRLGVDVSGLVEAVGKSVSEFKPGDEVFGGCRGAFAEYVCAPASALVLKSHNVSFEQAAAVPVAALTALQGLRGKGRLQPGQNALINGAAGGVGTLAVQIARSLGAQVTGVCSTRNLEMVRSLGAVRVIDYTRENFTQCSQRYDLIFDLIGNHSLFALRRILNPNGIYVAAGGPTCRWMITFLIRSLTASLLSLLTSRKMVSVLAKSNKSDLTLARDLLESQKVVPVIDRRYKLVELPGAIRYLETGHARGKVVITLDIYGDLS